MAHHTHNDTHLVWIDLEMTGLNAEHDFILEIATIITDSQLHIIAHGPDLVIWQPEQILNNMGDWSQKKHTQSGLIDLVRASTITLDQAAQQTVDFIRTYCNPHKAPLCGNSVWQDRIFLHKHMPSVLDFLHYRIIDVSSVKELVRRWYPDSQYANYKKKESHRALEDIVESIEELRCYREQFFIGE